MGFFCYTCKSNVRGQPNNHPCTRSKYGQRANARIYDHSGNKVRRKAYTCTATWQMDRG